MGLIEDKARANVAAAYISEALVSLRLALQSCSGYTATDEIESAIANAEIGQGIIEDWRAFEQHGRGTAATIGAAGAGLLQRAQRADFIKREREACERKARSDRERYEFRGWLQRMLKFAPEEAGAVAGLTVEVGAVPFGVYGSPAETGILTLTATFTYDETCVMQIYGEVRYRENLARRRVYDLETLGSFLREVATGEFWA